jgi:hypothetical protein
MDIVSQSDHVAWCQQQSHVFFSACITYVSQSLLNFREFFVTLISAFGGRGSCDDQPWNNYWVCGSPSAVTGATIRLHSPWTDGTTELASRLTRTRSRQRTRLSPGSTSAKCQKADWRRGFRISLYCWLYSPPLTMAADRASVVLSPPAGRQAQAFLLPATAGGGPSFSASKQYGSRRPRVARPQSMEM